MLKPVLIETIKQARPPEAPDNGREFWATTFGIGEQTLTEDGRGIMVHAPGCRPVLVPWANVSHAVYDRDIEAEARQAAEESRLKAAIEQQQRAGLANSLASNPASSPSQQLAEFNARTNRKRGE